MINSPGDVLCKKRLQHLDELQSKARAVNTRLLDTERVGQGCVLASPAFERVAQSTLTEDGRRSPALRFGDPRVMALLDALCVGLNALGFTNTSLRAQVKHLLGVGYTVNQMSYDLSRLRLNGLIKRRPHTNTYQLTADGQRASRSSTPRSTTGAASAHRRRPPARTRRTTHSAAPTPTPHAWQRLPENSRQVHGF